MMRYLRDRLGERTTAWGLAAALAIIMASFFVPLERADIADTMRALAIPIFVGLFLWKDRE